MMLFKSYKKIMIFFILIQTVFMFENPSLFCADTFDYVGQGNKYYAEESYDLAIEAYKKVLASGYKSNEIFNNLGASYFFGKKDNKMAKKIFKKGLVFFPKDDWLHFNLSQVLLEMGELEKGVQEYKLYVKYSKNKKTTINTRRLREILLARGKKENDINTFFKEIVSVNPNDYSARFEIAKYHLSQHHFEKALREYNKILEIRPDFNLAYRGMGTCYYNLGNPQLALEYFKKAREAGRHVPDEFFEKLNREIKQMRGK